MFSLLDRSVGDLVAAMGAGTLGPVDLLETHLAHLERVNPLLNALIGRRFAAARAEAKAAEARYAAGERAPLLGVPCTIKEFLPVEGMPFTAGIPARRDVVADHDAEVVRRLRAAGAVIMGVSNVPEGGMWMETGNGLFGRTSNPWDLRCTAGGSSGGEGALVSCGAAPFGVGSDVGGSIRIPAAFCGVPGHKPTGGLVPNTGHWPGNPGIGGFLCTGPLARTVDDLYRVLGILAGPDPRDPATTRGAVLGDPATVDPSQLTVYPVAGDGRMRLDRAVRDGLDRAARALEAAGATIGHLDGRRLRKGLSIWSAMLTLGGSDPYKVLLGDGQAIRPLAELFKRAFGRSDHTVPALVLAAVEPLTGLLPGRIQRYIDEGHALQAELEDTLGPHGVLLYPPYSATAMRHNAPMLRPVDAMCTGLFNVMEFPGTVMPVGFDRHGLPISVQLLAARGNDHVTLAAAAALETQLGGWRRSEPADRPRRRSRLRLRPRRATHATD